MIFLLLSIFGLFMSDRFVSRLEKFKLVSDNKRKLFIAVNIPSIYFLFFKDQIIIFFIYIGLILLSLTFFSIYFHFFLKKVFFNSHIRVIDAVLMMLKTGISPLSAVKTVHQTLNKHEKVVFEPLLFVNSDLKVPIYASNASIEEFFSEMESILRSNTKVIDQLDRFRKGLRIQKNIRHRSRMASLQVRMQAIVAVCIYIFLFLFAIYELGLLKYVSAMVLSMVMMGCGVYWILLKGSKIKWTV